MKQAYCKFFLGIAFVFTIGFSKAQSTDSAPPKVGSPLPDYTLENITHYKTQSASLKDFKGKWLFLDFWFVNCSACIASFPKINSFQKEFKQELDYVLVGINEKKKFGGKDIQKLFEGMRERQHLELISAYDSVLSFRWNITSMPYIVIVDPKGIVRHITNGIDMTKEKIRDMIDGKPVKFSLHVTDWVAPEYDITQFPGSADDRLVYRSILTKSNGELSLSNDFSRFARLPEKHRKNGFKVTSAPLQRLYHLAYTGRSFWSEGDKLNGKPLYSEFVYEVSDTTLFSYDQTFSAPEFRGHYSYNLAVPLAKSKDTTFMMNTMQRDLKAAFGFEVATETRKMPVWELVVTDPKAGNKLKTKGAEQYIGDGTESFAFPSGFTARNIPVKYLLFNAAYYLGGSDHSWFFDATGITHNIDIEIKANMTDMDAIQKSLRKNGLEFRRAQREFQVIVIRDPVE